MRRSAKGKRLASARKRWLKPIRRIIGKMMITKSYKDEALYLLNSNENVHVTRAVVYALLHIAQILEKYLPVIRDRIRR